MSWFRKIPIFFDNQIHRIRSSWFDFLEFMKLSSWRVKLSMLIMGLGQLTYRQFVKGFLYLFSEIGIIFYFFYNGFESLVGLFTLGTVVGDPFLGIEGDNSINMLIYGIFAAIVLVFFITLYIGNIKDVYKTSLQTEIGKKPDGFHKMVDDMVNKKFYKTTLVLPLIGVTVFNILPIVFMILLAFTNYGEGNLPPELVDWVGFDNFLKLLKLSTFAPTFGKILVWNIIWAVVSTAINYFGGLGLAILIEKKNVKGKRLWRTFPILAYAIPGFISMIAFKFLFSNAGPINRLLIDGGLSSIPFLQNKWSTRIIGIGVNAWISIPTTMLLATGILSNIPDDLYEAATVDGASKFQQFIKITFPFVLFSTTPVLISQFIGTFNNFGIFYFLRGEGMLTDGYFLASDCDLLINWLYNLSVANKYYSVGAAVSIIIFLITSTFSLIVYVRSASYKKEDTFR